jgi:undecaprenyl-diphosphatase
VPALATLLVLALIQGISEFLPISSDGHLVLAQYFLEFSGPRLAIDVALHIGTLAAVVLVFRRELLALAARARGGERRELWFLILGSLPAAIVGLGLREHIEPRFEAGRAAALGLLATAIFLWVGERARRRAAVLGPTAARFGWRDALLIGSAQALAILPGVSRSGTTIATALVRGADAREAARYSFLLSIPAVGGAVLLEVPALVRAGEFGVELALAVLATFVVGVLALRFLLAFLGRGAFRWCAYYCAAAGTTALFLVG